MYYIQARLPQGWRYLSTEGYGTRQTMGALSYADRAKAERAMQVLHTECGYSVRLIERRHEGE